MKSDEAASFSKYHFLKNQIHHHHHYHILQNTLLQYQSICHLKLGQYRKYLNFLTHPNTFSLYHLIQKSKDLQKQLLHKFLKGCPCQLILLLFFHLHCQGPFLPILVQKQRIAWKYAMLLDLWLFAHLGNQLFQFFDLLFCPA